MNNLLQRITKVNIKDEDPIEKTKTNIIIYIALLIIISVIPFLVGSLVLREFAVSFFSIILFIPGLATYILIKKGKKTIAKYVIIVSISLAVLVITYFSGGIHSQGILLLVVCIVFAFYYFNMRNAIITGLLIILAVVADIIFNFSESISIKFDPLTFAILKLTCFIMASILISGFFVFVTKSQIKMNERLKKDIQHKLDMLENIKGVSEHIETTSEQTEEKIKDSVNMIEELNNISISVGKLFDAQETSKEQTIEAIDRMNESLNVIEDEISQQSAFTEESAALIESFINNIEHINNITGEMNESFNELKTVISSGNTLISSGEKSIEKLIEIESVLLNTSSGLGEIAENINVLAINANIEAANSGSAGTGFRVVANEVRNLAVESQNNINEMTGNLETFRKRIENVSTMFDKINKAFVNIEKHNLKTKTLVDDVHNLMSEQSSNSGQFMDSLRTLIDGAEKMRNSSDVINKRMSNIKDITGGLENSFGEVKRASDNQYSQIKLLSDNLDSVNEMYKQTKEKLNVLYQSIRQFI